MEYIYGALVLHAAGKPVNEDSLKKVLTAAGVKVDETRVKARTAALEGVNIDEALKASVATWSGAPDFIVVSTYSFFPSVQATIRSIAPNETTIRFPSVPAPAKVSAAIIRSPSPSRALATPRFSSYSRIESVFGNFAGPKNVTSQGPPEGPQGSA